MTDKSLGITVTGDISDVMSKLEEFTGKLDEIEDKSISLDLDVNEGELDNLSTEANEAAEDVAGIGDASEAAGSEVDTSMSTASSSVSEVGTSASEAQSQVDELGDEALETGDEFEFGMNEATIAIMAATAALELGAQQLDEWNIGAGQLSIQSDIAEGDLREMLAYITNATFPMEEAEQYVGYLDRVGVEGTEALAENATYMDWIHDALGITSDSVIKLMQSYTVMGGNIDDVSESFNALYYAQSNMNADTMEQFIPWLQKYDFTLRELGLSWDAAAVAVVAAQKKFGGGRAAYQGLNEVIQESNGDISKMEELLGLQAGALSNASEETGKYEGKLAAAASQEAEHKTLLQQIYAWLEDLAIQYGDVGSVIMQFTEIMAGLWLVVASGAKLLDFFNVTENASKTWGQMTLNAFKRVGGGVKDLGSTLLDNIKSWIGWGDEAAKATEEVAVKVSEGAGKGAEAGETFGESIGRGFSRGGSKTAELIDEAGNVIWRDTDDIIGRVAGQAPKAEKAGAGITEGIGTGILSRVSRLAGDLSVPLVIVTSGIEAIYNIGENLDRSPLELIFDPFTSMLPPMFRDSINYLLSLGGMFTYEKMLSSIFGENAAADIQTWVTDNIQNPFRGGLDELGSIITTPPKLAALPGDIYNYLSQVPGAIDSALVNAPTAFDNATDQIAYDTGLMLGTLYKFPGRAYTALLPTGQNMYNALVNSPAYLQGAWINTAAWFTALPGTLYGYGANAWNGLTNGFNSAYGNVVGAVYSVPNTVDGAVSYITGLPGTLYQDGMNAWNGLTNGFNAGLGGVHGAVDSFTGTIQGGIQWIIDLPGNMYIWGKNTIDAFVDGINDAMGNAKGYIEDKLGWLFRGFAAASPPPEGPLSTIDIWGERVGSSFVEGVGTGLIAGKGQLSSALGDIGGAWGQGVISGITSQTSAINAAAAAATKGLYGRSPPETGPLQDIDVWGENVGMAFSEGLMAGIGDVDLLSNVSMPLPSVASVFNSNSLGGVVVQITGPITVPEGSDPVQVGQDFARGAAPTMADELRRQVGNMGINPVNDRR